jgi:hypothetical protein
MSRLLLASLFIFSLRLWAPLPPGTLLYLSVPPRQQLKLTSCGAAVLAMAYQYAYPQAGLDEQAILVYAAGQGYYTEKKFPFTSPANLVKLTQHYTRAFASGTVSTPAEGLELLTGALRQGRPVIIDVLVRLDAPRSGAHFVLVTGLSVAADNPGAIRVYYNDPLTGKNKASPWYGPEGLWQAWRHNGDPGGAGWWLALQAPLPEREKQPNLRPSVRPV